MIVCIDVGYDDAANQARAACVLVDDWSDREPAGEFVVEVDGVQPYQPGQFYRRELPCLLAVIDHLPALPDTVVIDGYVWLDDQQQKGLGGYLYESLNKTIPVIGVAKTRFAGAVTAIEVRRGTSNRPLYVTSAGINVQQAALLIRGMHGDHRLPTLLKRVDRLSRA